MTSTLMEGREGIEARVTEAGSLPRMRRALNLARGLAAAKPVRRIVERIAFGGERRRALLMRLLVWHDRSLLRRQWALADEMPHFYDHRVGSLLFSAGEEPGFGMFRGFLAAQVMRPSDVVLDIGCGDGFFASRLFSPRVAHVDSIDIEPSAIEHASRHNHAPNVSYHLLDAVAAPFPRARYDVVVWDGALGHFAPDVTQRMLVKICEALAPGGVFVGSESLGEEGHDHLQFFADLEALRAVLAPAFAAVQVSQMDYVIPGGLLRHEGYWRCVAGDTDRLAAAAWH
jgi:SAM-dependent methyltransferase